MRKQGINGEATTAGIQVRMMLAYTTVVTVTGEMKRKGRYIFKVALSGRSRVTCRIFVSLCCGKIRNTKQTKAPDYTF